MGSAFNTEFEVIVANARSWEDQQQKQKCWGGGAAASGGVS